MTHSEPPRRPPVWLRQTKRLFPHPLFAGCISAACLVVGVLFAGVAINVPGCWPMAVPSLVFFAGGLATASAALARSDDELSADAVDSGNRQSGKPTFAILVLLISVYTWMLTLAMHVFDAFFRNGPGSHKYYVTVAIAMASTLFMQFYGKRVVRQHFGPRGGRNLELRTRQAVYVAVFAVGCGLYFAWLMSW